MKNFIKNNLISLSLFLLLIAGIGTVYAAVVTPVFPTTANNFTEGAVIEEEDWNAIENYIGIKSTTSKETLSGRWNDLFASTTMPQITTLANLGTVKTSLTGVLKVTSGVLAVAGTGTSGNCVQWGASNALTDTGSACSTSGSVFPFTVDTNYAQTVVSTSTDVWFKVGLMASSTSYFSDIFSVNSTSTNATTTNATTTNMYVSGDFWVSGLTSALTITGSTGKFAEYAGTSCTNQFIRSLDALGAATCATVGSADVSLANLTATDGTLTFSGTYNGSTARTIGLNLASENTWTGGQTFTNATSTGTFSIPNGTAPLLSDPGKIAFDTSDNQFLIGTTTTNTPLVYPSVMKIWGATVASTSVDFISGGRIPLPIQRDGFTIKEIHCYVESGTSVVINLDTGAGGSNTDTVTCATTATSDTAMSTNYTIAASTLMELEIGTVTGAVDYVTFSVWGVYTRE